jgi:isopropylmalate/homocitrate/citramalate synthase
MSSPTAMIKYYQKNRDITGGNLQKHPKEILIPQDMEYIIKQATEVIKFIQSKGLEVRFSSEDSFRSDLVDLLNLYKTVDKVCGCSSHYYIIIIIVTITKY